MTNNGINYKITPNATIIHTTKNSSIIDVSWFVINLAVLSTEILRLRVIYTTHTIVDHYKWYTLIKNIYTFIKCKYTLQLQLYRVKCSSLLVLKVTSVENSRDNQFYSGILLMILVRKCYPFRRFTFHNKLFVYKYKSNRDDII